MPLLTGTWTGALKVVRSVDGGTTKQPLTINGNAWGQFSANCCEALGQRNLTGGPVSADLVALRLATAQARSGNSAALVNAVRINGFFAVPGSRLASNDTPVILVGAAGAGSTINANAAVRPAVLATDSRLKWLSSPTSADGSGCWLPRGA